MREKSPRFADAFTAEVVTLNFSKYLNTFVHLLNSDATLDQTFNSGEVEDEYYSKDIKLLADGKILVGGFVFDQDFQFITLIRLNPSGVLDTT